MRKYGKRILSLALAGTLACTLLWVPAAAVEPERTLWIVGDSTSCDFSQTDRAYYYPRYGYGTQVDRYLDGSYTVRNLAASGTSSLSFRNDKKEAYDALLAGMKAGDALIIAFGHNDEKTEEARYTDPNGDYRTPGSFAESLYTYYIQPARAAGAEVVLCTPIVRRRPSDESWSDNQLHLTAPSGEFRGGDYPQAIRDLGRAVGAPVVDLTAATKALYEELGADKTEDLHARQAKEGVDNTHLNLYGAQVVAQLLARGLKETDTALAGHVDPDAFVPDVKQVTVGPEYVELSAEDYAPPEADSALFADYVAGAVHFKGTAFGQLGGDPTVENHVLETDEQGRMHVAVRNNKGKIASGEDGVVMYYYRVPVGKQFKLSAKATLNAVGSKNPNQIAFGLMARDDMYVDTHRSPGFNSNYVAAGTFGSGSTNCFYRKGGALSEPVPLTVETVEAGRSYELSIVSNTDGFACSFGREPGQSQGYDFDLNAIDTQYFYVGMFASRNVDVTFSDIYLEIEGEVVADTREVSRGQAVQALYRAAGEPEVQGGVPFADVAADSGYLAAVRWAKEAGVVQGDGNGFRPEDPVTREQLAAMLYRWAKVRGLSLAATRQAYADGERVSPWAAEAMAWALSRGVLPEKPEGFACPAGVVGRSELKGALEGMEQLR